jgi:hypothetical protein
LLPSEEKFDVTGRMTPEMIEAGACALALYDREFESLEEAAERIYRAIMAARRTVV